MPVSDGIKLAQRKEAVNHMKVDKWMVIIGLHPLNTESVSVSVKAEYTSDCILTDVLWCF